MKKDKKKKNISQDDILEQMKDEKRIDDTKIGSDAPAPPKKTGDSGIRDALITATRIGAENAVNQRPRPARPRREQPVEEQPESMRQTPVNETDIPEEPEDEYEIAAAEIDDTVTARQNAPEAIVTDTEEPDGDPYETSSAGPFIDLPPEIFEDGTSGEPIAGNAPVREVKTEESGSPKAEYTEEYEEPASDGSVGRDATAPETPEVYEEPDEDLISKDAYEAAMSYLGLPTDVIAESEDNEKIDTKKVYGEDAPEDKITEEENIPAKKEEPLYGEAAPDEDEYEGPKATTKEIETDSYESESEYETSSDDIDVDALMKKYLTLGEYDEVMAEAAEQSETDEELQRRRLEDAEEYISAIEREMAKDSAAGESKLETEREKVIKNMDLDGEDFDETDVNLMIAFGMQDELVEKLGEENSKSVEEALDKDAKTFSSPHDRRRANDGSVEFTSRDQAKDIFAAYKKDITSIILRAAGAVILMILTFMLENSKVLPFWLEPPYHVIRSMVSLQLMLFGALLVYKPLLKGLKNLFRFRPSVESVLGLSYIAGIIYHIAICIPGVYVGSNAEEKIHICNFPLMLCVLFAIIFDYMKLKRETFAFNVVSSKRIKYTLAKMDDSESEPEKEAFSEFIEEDAPMFKINKTNFVDGFFRRITEESTSKTVMTVLIPLCIIISLAFIAAGIFLRGGVGAGGVVFTALTYGYLALSLSLPLSALIAYGYPMFRASKVAHSVDSAIIGTSSVNEYSEAASISFEDKAVFPAAGAKVRSIKVYGQNRIDRIIYNLTSIYNVTGGPLRDVFNKATNDIGKSDDVEIMDIADDGYEVIVSGKHMLLGRRSYIIANGFTPLYDDDDAMIEATGTATITYLICNDEVAAKIYVSYQIDPDFESILKQLRSAGICAGVKTCDPNIDDTVLAKYIELDKYPIKIIKKHTIVDESKTEPRFESGIVSKRDPKSLLRALSLCEKIKQSVRSGAIILSVSMIAGIAIMAFLAVKGITANLTSLHIALYQLFWLIPTMIISATGIRK
ncbi:MAG: hypothetical protein IJT91_00030 [Clostridia bacterium]|nr:hypothetical protein [Clostridia bacterium]